MLAYGKTSLWVHRGELKKVNTVVNSSAGKCGLCTAPEAGWGGGDGFRDKKGVENGIKSCGLRVVGGGRRTMTNFNLCKLIMGNKRNEHELKIFSRGNFTLKITGTRFWRDAPRWAMAGEGGGGEGGVEIFFAWHGGDTRNLCHKYTRYFKGGSS